MGPTTYYKKEQDTGGCSPKKETAYKKVRGHVTNPIKTS